MTGGGGRVYAQRGIGIEPRHGIVTQGVTVSIPRGSISKMHEDLATLSIHHTLLLDRFLPVGIRLMGT